MSDKKRDPKPEGQQFYCVPADWLTADTREWLARQPETRPLNALDNIQGYPSFAASLASGIPANKMN